MKVIVACVVAVALFSFSLGVLFGSSLAVAQYADIDHPECRMISDRLSDLTQKDVRRLDDGRWCGL